MKLSKKQVKHILDITYPDYKGRKFNLMFKTNYQLENYWSGGTKSYIKAINNNGEVSLPSPATNNPYNSIAHTSFEIPKDICLVEHSFFCGKDKGIRFIFHPDTILLPKLIKEVNNNE